MLSPSMVMPSSPNAARKNSGSAARLLSMTRVTSPTVPLARTSHCAGPRLCATHDPSLPARSVEIGLPAPSTTSVERTVVPVA